MPYLMDAFPPMEYLMDEKITKFYLWDVH